MEQNIKMDDSIQARQKETSTGALVGSIIIIVILIIGGIYLIGKSQLQLKKAAPTQDGAGGSVAPAASTNTNLSNSADLNGIQNDLNSVGSGINSAGGGLQ